MHFDCHMCDNTEFRMYFVEIFDSKPMYDHNIHEEV